MAAAAGQYINKLFPPFYDQPPFYGKARKPAGNDVIMSDFFPVGAVVSPVAADATPLRCMRLFFSLTINKVMLEFLS
jgi:hypothetical protein